MTQQSAIQFATDTQQLNCSGEWNLANLPTLEADLANIKWPSNGLVTINGQAITKMDSAGAWLIVKLQRLIEQKKLSFKLIQFSEQHQSLIQIIENESSKGDKFVAVKKPKLLAEIGATSLAQIQQFNLYLTFIGKLAYELMRLLPFPSQWRWKALVAVLYRTGFQGLPIVALLSFLIGVVLTYQMGLQLRNYGANIYIVDLLGLSILREFAPLITAIMVSGRTGSAFTASIGMMKLNQEIDALDTLGVTPAELLLIPRVLGLFIALPLLTMWSDIFGVFGGMVMSNNMLGISWYDFLHRFPHVIPLRSFMIGIGKAPVFALIISSIGCFQGMQVKNSADNVGQNTTKSVVLAIFFIIVADAMFSILFSKMKL